MLFIYKRHVGPGVSSQHANYLALAAPLATVSIVGVTRVTRSGAWMKEMVPTLPGLGGCQLLVCFFI